MIAMAQGGVGEFVRHGVEGLLVDSDLQMAQATAALCASPDRLTMMQHHNSTVLPAVSWDAVLAATFGAYDLAAGLSRRSNAAAATATDL